MYIDKKILVNRIINAAQIYKNKLVGKVFLVAYEDKYVEIMFKVNSFLHLSGVATSLSAENFYKKAWKRQLRDTEIFFNSEHPVDFADLKTTHLNSLYKIVTTDTLIGEGITVATAVFPIGITDVSIFVCFDKNTDKSGKLLNNFLIPYSFRIESIDNSKVGTLYEVKCVLERNSNEPKYKRINFGSKSDVEALSDEIKKLIDMKELQ